MAVEDVQGQLAGYTGGDWSDVGICFFAAHHDGNIVHRVEGRSRWSFCKAEVLGSYSLLTEVAVGAVILHGTRVFRFFMEAEAETLECSREW